LVIVSLDNTTLPLGLRDLPAIHVDKGTNILLKSISETIDRRPQKNLPARQSTRSSHTLRNAMMICAGSVTTLVGIAAFWGGDAKLISQPVSSPSPKISMSPATSPRIVDKENVELAPPARDLPSSLPGRFQGAGRAFSLTGVDGVIAV
jgi:hypothetical protein